MKNTNVKLKKALKVIIYFLFAVRKPNCSNFSLLNPIE